MQRCFDRTGLEHSRYVLLLMRTNTVKNHSPERRVEESWQRRQMDGEFDGQMLSLAEVQTAPPASGGRSDSDGGGG